MFQCYSLWSLEVVVSSLLCLCSERICMMWSILFIHWDILEKLVFASSRVLVTSSILMLECHCASSSIIQFNICSLAVFVFLTAWNVSMHKYKIFYFQYPLNTTVPNPRDFIHTTLWVFLWINNWEFYAQRNNIHWCISVNGLLHWRNCLST